MPSIRDASLLMRELAGVVKSHITTALGPLIDRVKALEERQPERGEKGEAGLPGDRGADGLQGDRGEPGEKGAPGERGEHGAPGRDADPVDLNAVADAVVAKLLASDRIDTLSDLAATKAVLDYFEANPVRHGKDGRDGDAGQRGEKGEAGEKGNDGAGIADLLIDRDGHLIATMTDGRTKSLGLVVGKDGDPGRNGQDGKNGLSFEQTVGTFDAERGFILTLANGERKVEFVLPYMRHGGFYSEGKAAKAGESWTHDGALWIAKRDTTTKPCLENREDWILAARKGRDGKDGKNGIDKTAPVKVTADA